MIVHLLRTDERYIRDFVALCGVVVDAHDAQLARGLRTTCRECARLDREDADLVATLSEKRFEPFDPDRDRKDDDIDDSDSDEAEAEFEHGEGEIESGEIDERQSER